MKLSWLLLLVYFGSETAGLSIPIVSDIQDIISLAHDIGDIASGNVPLLSLFTGSKPDPVQQKLDGLSKQIEELSNLFNVKLDNALSEILTNVPRETDFRARMSQLSVYITRIDFLFDNHRKITKKAGDYSQLTIDQYVEAATSLHQGDIPETLNQMHKLFVGNHNSGAQESFLQVASGVFLQMDRSSLCGKKKSQQQRLYDIYQSVIFTEIKGFLMNNYAYGILGIYQNISFAEEAKRSEERLISRANEYLAGIKAAMVNIPREIYVCDPEKHSTRSTHTEMFRAIQRTVLQEWMLRSEQSCYGSCSDINSQTIYRNFSNPESDFKKNWHPVHVCEGRMNECRDLDEVDICELDGNFKERLVYAKSKNFGYYGSNKNCFFAKKSTLDSFMYNLRWCEPCICTCTEEKAASTAVRAFSFRKQRSDLEKNMVVTGVRFQRKDNLIHIQIEQGKLIENGRIEEGSNEWVPLEDFVPKLDTSWQGGFSIVVNGEEKPLNEEEDYGFMHYYRKKIHLDLISANYSDYVVTGAHMVISRYDSKAFAFGIRISRFNFTTGQIITEEDTRPFAGIPEVRGEIHSRWLYADYTLWVRPYTARTVIDVKGKMDPVKSYGHVPTSEDHSEIELTYSNEVDDVGQSTLPYFDTQTVAATPRVALDGVGFYHRSNGISGGFISPTVITHDIPKYLNPTIDISKLREGELDNIEDDKGGTSL